MAWPYTYTYPYVANPAPVQPQASTQLQQTQQQPTSLMTIFVNSESEVNDYPVAAGTTVQLINFKSGKFYLKSTGTNGVPQPIRTFSFTEDKQIIQNDPNLVSRSEFDALNVKLDKLLKELGGES